MEFSKSGSRPLPAIDVKISYFLKELWVLQSAAPLGEMQTKYFNALNSFGLRIVLFCFFEFLNIFPPISVNFKKVKLAFPC